MAFVKKTWKDRIVQYANRRLLTKSGGEVEQVTVTRDEGTISEAGDRFDAATMNNLEKRVKDAFDDLNAADLPIASCSATNTKDYIESGLSGKADTIPDGSYTVSGIWSESYYASRSIWVSFPRADLYTISITRARYVSGTNTMTDITTTTQITNKNALGFQVYTTSNADNHFGDVQFTASLT